MKFALIAFYQVIPPYFGTAMVSHDMAKYLPGEKSLFQIAERNDDVTLNGDTKIINLKVNTNSRLTKFMGLLRAYPGMIKQLKDLMPDVIILEGASWALYSYLMLKFIRWAKIRAKVIFHDHNVEYELRKQRDNKIIAMITWFAEKAVLKKSDASFCVSERDAAYCEELYHFKPYVLPSGVDLFRFKAVSQDEVQEIKNRYGIRKNSVLFLGGPSYRPNKEAIDALVFTIMPQVIGKIPNAQLLVVGGELDLEREFLVSVGQVQYEKVPIFIEAVDLCVAPILSGSGTKIKILDYMAGGKPVLSTSKGAEGIEVVKDRDLIIEDNLNLFAEKMIGLLQNPSESEKIGVNGRMLIERIYSWESIMEKFVEKLKEINLI